jgi:choline kinase
MNILVLMAGKGQRFLDEGYVLPKPMIKVNGKSILEWTTESCPYLRGFRTMHKWSKPRLYFAVLKEHEKFGMTEFLTSIYRHDFSVIYFDQLTKGNLDTAYQSCLQMGDYVHDDLLVLDSDNAYDDNGMKDFIQRGIANDKEAMGVMGFYDNDYSVPNKWSNACIEDYDGVRKLIGIVEKQDWAVHHPKLIGNFYFRHTQTFIEKAKNILDNEQPIQNEYYMSMVPASEVHNNNVWIHYVKDVVPLGTPQDIRKFQQ